MARLHDLIGKPAWPDPPTQLTAALARMSIDERLDLELTKFSEVRASVMEQAATHLAMRNSVMSAV